jgi:hypothetical protein
MASLFDTTRINDLTLPHRFIRSATWTRLADADGACTWFLHSDNPWNNEMMENKPSPCALSLAPGAAP